MMEITIFIKEKKLNQNVSTAFAEYKKRMTPFCRVRLELCGQYESFPKPKRTRTASYAVIAGTKTPSSEEFADMLQTLQTGGTSSVYFYICEDADTQSHLFPDIPCLNLSGFFMSNGTVAVVLAEQLYRAYTILNHITYHK